MVLSVFLHMARVFYHGAYKPPREFNWVIGVVLLTLTLLLSFTGYLLPWDQLAIWAITVGSNMARATPFLGYEGPGNQLLTINGIDMISCDDDGLITHFKVMVRPLKAVNMLHQKMGEMLEKMKGG